MDNIKASSKVNNQISIVGDDIARSRPANKAFLTAVANAFDSHADYHRYHDDLQRIHHLQQSSVLMKFP